MEAKGICQALNSPLFLLLDYYQVKPLGALLHGYYGKLCQNLISEMSISFNEKFIKEHNRSVGVLNWAFYPIIEKKSRVYHYDTDTDFDVVKTTINEGGNIKEISMVYETISTVMASPADGSGIPTAVTGFVKNQDLEPVANAEVKLLSRTYSQEGGVNESMVKTSTDERGYYSLQAETAYENSWITVTVSDYPDCSYFYTMHLKDGPQTADIILANKARYRAGQFATIATPYPPETAWGRYFRLDRVEGGQVVFERELMPQADTPYIILPDDDFVIDYDASQPQFAGKVAVEGAYLQGCYQSWDYSQLEQEYGVMLDATPDCEYHGARNSDGRYITLVYGCRVGANHAILVLDGYHYPWHQKTSSPAWRNEWFLKEGLVLNDTITGETLVLSGKTTGGIDVTIREKLAAEPQRYNLSGQRVDASYGGCVIEDGRKILRP